MAPQHTWQDGKDISILNAYYAERLHGNEPPCIKLTSDKVLEMCSSTGLLRRLEESAPELMSQIRIFDLRSLDGKYWLFLQADEGADGTDLMRWVLENKRTEDEEHFGKCLAHVVRRMERLKNGLSGD